MSVESLILAKLKCKHCEDYVKRAPIMMYHETFICVNCYNILPEENRASYIHQYGLERICEVIQFPCRYHLNGCTKKLDFNSTRESHEDSCRFNVARKYDFIRFNSVEDDSSDTEIEDDHDVSPTMSRDLKVEMNCTFKRNKTTRKVTILRFSVDVKSDNRKLYSNFEENKSVPISIRLRGVISLGWKNPTVKITSMDIIKENPLAYQNVRCLNCKDYKCQKLHDCCPTCGLEHYKCFCSKAMKVPQLQCKYFVLGCRESTEILNLPQHIQQCEYQEYSCPFPNCFWSGSMQTMKIIHLPNEHKEKTITSDQIKRSNQTDDVWVMIAFGKVFVCKQYCYEDNTDIVVQYMGSSNNSEKFVYCIRIATLPFYQEAKCCTTNSYILDKGIQFASNCEYVLFIKKIKVNGTY